MVDRPRSRSFSVTRSTQTHKDLNFLIRDEPKTITFKAELSDAKDVSTAAGDVSAAGCDAGTDACDAVGVSSPQEYDGLQFIDDNLEDPESKKENPGRVEQLSV